MNKKLTITGFFPFLNDWGTIGSLVALLNEELKKTTSQYEILIIDDGSESRSREVLHTLKTAFPRLRIISHRKNRGYGSAVRSGISHAKMDWIFYTDGDGQYDPRELSALIAKLRPNIDIVNGFKIKRADPWYRILMGKTYHHVVQFLFQTPIRDTDCDFRLMRRSIFDKVTLTSSSGLICIEMIKKIHDHHFRFAQAPVHHFWRTSGKSQFFNLRRVAQVAIGMLKLWHDLVIKKVHLSVNENKHQPLSRRKTIGRHRQPSRHQP